VVGVNKFQVEEDASERALLKVDESVGAAQVKKLGAMKAGRDNLKVQGCLDAIRAASRDEGTNLMPLIVEAVKAYVTEGEICGVLREEFGEYRENIVL